MNRITRPPLPHMTTDDFLAWPGDGTGRRHQLVDGEIRPVSPASHTHAAIQANLAYLLISAVHAAGLPLQVAIKGAVISGLNASTNVRVPDLVVTATLDERGQQAVPDPVLLVEVLSPGNQDSTRDNVWVYATLPSVQEIAVLHSTRVLAEVHRRTPAGAWLPDPEYSGPGERLRLASVDLILRRGRRPSQHLAAPAGSPRRLSAPVAVMPGRMRLAQVSPREVVAFVEQGGIVRLGAGVSEAVAHVQSGRVPPFAEPSISVGREVRLALADADELEAGSVQESANMRASRRHGESVGPA